MPEGLKSRVFNKMAGKWSQEELKNGDISR
jgi:hypothetical protein